MSAASHPKSLSRGVILDDGKVLLLKRSDAVHHHPAHWQVPGGKIEEGETPEDAVIREVVEEVGLSFTPAGILFTSETHHVFLGEWSGDVVVDGHEAVDARWFTYPEAVAVPLTANTREILDRLHNAGILR